MFLSQMLCAFFRVCYYHDYLSPTSLTHTPPRITITNTYTHIQTHTNRYLSELRMWSREEGRAKRQLLNKRSSLQKELLSARVAEEDARSAAEQWKEQKHSQDQESRT